MSEPGEPSHEAAGPAPGLTRRNLLLSGGSALVGAMLGIGGERLLADNAEGDIRLWEARAQVLNSVFFNAHSITVLPEVIKDTVQLPPGTAVHTFPNAQPIYEIEEELDNADDGPSSYENGVTVLQASVTVENPVLLGHDPFTDLASHGERWMLIDGPEGAGYVKSYRDDFSEPGRKVLLGAYWSGKAADGMLRFTASGFAYAGETTFGTDQIFNDFDGNWRPDVERLGEGMQSSEYIQISRTEL